MGKKKKMNKVTSVWKEFKTFISRGNVVDMAVGVIMGSSFGAIVTSLTNIFLSLCTWPIPGGISGLITILPALHAGQMPPDGLEQVLTVTEWTKLSTAQQSLYTQYGGQYVYKSVPVLNWGAFLNAIISFIVIALVLFIIVKVVSILKNKREQLKQLELEAYYKKHPEERPKPEEPKPAPEDPQITLLKEIRDELKKNAVASESKEAETK